MIQRDIFGWFPYENQSNLLRLITEHQVETVVEIGSFLGKSAAFFTEHVTAVWCVDKWCAPDDVNPYLPEGVVIPDDFFPLFQRNLEMVGRWNKVIPVRGFSTDPWVLEAVPPTVDLVYIDGLHTYEGCLADIQAYNRRATKVICGDDYSDMFPGVKQAVQESFPQFQHDGFFWWVVK